MNAPEPSAPDLPDKLDPPSQPFPRGSSLAAAIAFYTCLPVPSAWMGNFQGVARLAPYVGWIIGGVLAGLDQGLVLIGMPSLTRSAGVVLAWVAVTGGLHLDGAMDTADGLAVLDPQRRLEVMVDSHAGAFGVMAAIALIVLKTAALSDLEHHRALSLIAVAGWGRWGQLVAIARYPYLKPTGKGAFHKTAVKTLWDTIPSFGLLLGLSGIWIALSPPDWPIAGAIALGGPAIAWLTGAWFHHKLGGHTGDTYGAVVEWTEALLLCLLTVID